MVTYGSLKTLFRLMRMSEKSRKRILSKQYSAMKNKKGKLGKKLSKVDRANGRYMFAVREGEHRVLSRPLT